MNNISKTTLLRYTYVYVFLILIFTKISISQISDDNDGAENILINSNYLISMPTVKTDTLFLQNAGMRNSF